MKSTTAGRGGWNALSGKNSVTLARATCPLHGNRTWEAVRISRCRTTVGSVSVSMWTGRRNVSPGLLDDVTVSPQALAEKFCGGSQCFIARSNASIDHIFSEIYEVPDSIKKGYLKVKILELLLFLSCLDARGDQAGERCASRSQAALARDVSAYLTACMDRRITLDQLSARFHVSGTNIKTSFKLVYGISIYAYIRKLKMEAAAVVLANTDRSILEIAGQFGYDNGSKFAKAFRDVMGAPPTSYRVGLRV